MLQLTPQSASDFKVLAIEHLMDDARKIRSGAPTLAGDVKFPVNEVKPWAATLEPDDLTKSQRSSILNIPASLARNFDVHRQIDAGLPRPECAFRYQIFTKKVQCSAQFCRGCTQGLQG